ncbi:hypothetical protein [Klebsiella pneumoniae]|uniref:hypothetical protein n=1 Tax=Klebsiella pneumoniae TaxID=573 RepID=UPI00388F8967
MAFNPELGSTSPAVLLDNAERLDKLVNGPAADVPDRGGDPLHSWRQIMAVNQAKQDQLDDIITSLDTASFTFSDTTAGLAGTTDGQYFRVPQGEGDAVGFIYYKNSAGAAVVVASLASAETQNCSGKTTARNWPPLLMMTAPARWHWMRGAGYLLLTRQKTSVKRLGKPVMTGLLPF